MFGSRSKGFRSASRAGRGCRAIGGAKILQQSGQVIKGVWRISRCQEAMKGVEDCEKPGEAVKRALIPGFLNYCMLNS